MLISVVIPLYNKAPFVVRCLESLVVQTHQELEIIVVDDESSDGSVEEAEKVKDDRIKIIRREANGGCAAARNDGMMAARGKFIALQDADDFSHSTRMAVQLAAIRHYGIPTCKTRRIDITRVAQEQYQQEFQNPLNPQAKAGSFMSLMFPRLPRVLENDSMRLMEELAFMADLAYVWGPCVNLRRPLYCFDNTDQQNRIYPKRKMTDEWFAQRHLAFKHNAKLWRTWNRSREARLGDAKIVAESVTRDIRSGAFFNEP